MRELRKHFTVGLVLLMCALTGHRGESAPSAAPGAAAAGGGAQQGWKRVVEVLKQVKESRARRGLRTEAPFTTRARTAPVKPKDICNLKTENTREVSVVVLPIGVRTKDQFLRYITGPLYFSPKCRKHMYRLYYQTRDCTIPAYFKRCARLLTRLAGSPQCTEG